MRIAIVYLAVRRHEALSECAKALARSFEARGFSTSIYNLKTDTDAKLVMYDFVVLGSEGVGLLGSKVEPSLQKRLSSLGNLDGKRSMGFALKSLMGSERAAIRVCEAMESVGMRVIDTQVFQAADNAKSYAAAIKVEKA